MQSTRVYVRGGGTRVYVRGGGMITSGGRHTVIKILRTERTMKDSLVRRDSLKGMAFYTTRMVRFATLEDGKATASMDSEFFTTNTQKKHN